jgi:hypothetical protein
MCVSLVFFYLNYQFRQDTYLQIANFGSTAFRAPFPLELQWNWTIVAIALKFTCHLNVQA